jgi:hypothetical protein
MVTATLGEGTGEQPDARPGEAGGG